MFGLSPGMLFVVDTIIIIAFFLKELGRAINRHRYGYCRELPYPPNGEDYNEPISLLSPHNTASEITKKDGLFYVTIENSVTGEKQTLSNRNKRTLCIEAEFVATRFAEKERDEYHTV